jgi:hypothetical protein
MCVIERGITRLAKRLKVPARQLAHRTWKQIFDRLNPAIQTLPYTTDNERARRDRYSEAMAHLNNVKDAWRNPTMHSRRRYDQSEAVAIFENVKTFMNFLATKIVRG